MPTKPTNLSIEEGSFLASCRQASGFTQTALAERVGVSRQFLNQLEAGRVLPNVAVALRLAEALGRTVEELFKNEEEPAVGSGIPVSLAQADLPEGTRLGVARVAKRWVGHAVDTPMTMGGGFGEADGVLAWRKGAAVAQTYRTRDELEQNVVVAGCDPALALLRAARPASGQAGRCLWVNCGSGRALELLEAGQVHIAGVHYSGTDGEDSEANLRAVARHDAAGKWRLLRFTRWEQGWMVRPGERGGFRGAEDLGSGKTRLANREAGAGVRHWLDAQLAGMGLKGPMVPGYEREFTNHWACAGALSEGKADVALGPRAVAAAFGLKFIPVGEVGFDLVVPKAHLEHPRVAALLHSVRSAGLRREIESLPGYRACEAGAWVTETPGAGGV